MLTATVQNEVTPLYHDVLGAAWNDLAPAVRHAHSVNGRLDSVGLFDITHGAGILARLLAWCAQLPQPGIAVPTRLRIVRREHHEDWHRTFGPHLLRSAQSARSEHLLAERFGLFEIRFQLEVRAGGICYVQRCSTIRIGRGSLPLPSWLTPRVSATEMPGPTAHTTIVCVIVHLPLVGLLIRYQGQMESPEVLR